MLIMARVQYLLDVIFLALLVSCVCVQGRPGPTRILYRPFNPCKIKHVCHPPPPKPSGPAPAPAPASVGSAVDDHSSLQALPFPRCLGPRSTSQISLLHHYKDPVANADSNCPPTSTPVPRCPPSPRDGYSDPVASSNTGFHPSSTSNMEKSLADDYTDPFANIDPRFPPPRP